MLSSYKVLCPRVVTPSMTGEQIAKAILDAVNIDQAVYRLGQNKVVEPPDYHKRPDSSIYHFPR